MPTTSEPDGVPVTPDFQVVRAPDGSFVIVLHSRAADHADLLCRFIVELLDQYPKRVVSIVTSQGIAAHADH